MADTMKVIHDDFVAVMAKHGIIDGAYVGIMMDGKSVSSFTYGFGQPDLSNVERGERLVGTLDVVKSKIVNCLTGVEYHGK